jgi:pSer/pThr/pTyr-binding forkhead associated (FHA) protein
MAAGTKVQLRLGERVVSEVPFSADELRIGRMKENDLVVNNLAVSRFHAVLRKVGAGFEVEDLGSENGTFVDGVRIRGCAPLPSGAEIGIGKHVLTIRSGAEPAVAPARAVKSDAWDAAQTYFAPELAPRLDPLEEATAEATLEAACGAASDALPASAVPSAGPAPGAESLEPLRPERRPAAALDLPDPEERFAFGEDELASVPLAPSLAPAVPEAGALPAVERGGETALFDFAASTDLGLSEPSLARVAAARAVEPSTVGAPSAPLHAGLIVARAGRIECVTPLRGSELVAGRSPGCDLVLGAAGISRRHARFVRDGGALRVLDLGSANGIAVNGERVKERVLAVGDVVTIDDYTLTYVLDHEPIEQAVRSAAAPSTPGTGHVTVLHEAPFASIPERDLIVDADEDDGDLEKEPLVEAERGTLRTRAGVAPALGEEWVVEVVLRADGLPAELRGALAKLGSSALRVPAELRIRRS